METTVYVLQSYTPETDTDLEYPDWADQSTHHTIDDARAQLAWLTDTLPEQVDTAAELAEELGNLNIGRASWDASELHEELERLSELKWRIVARRFEDTEVS